MGSKNSMAAVGGYAFIVGAVLAIVLGFVAQAAWSVAVLAILGLAVALLNITDKEVYSYLIANIAVIIGANSFNAMLVILAAPLGLGGFATILQAMTSNLVFFVAPGAVVIALKQIYAIAREA